MTSQLSSQAGDGLILLSMLPASVWHCLQSPCCTVPAALVVVELDYGEAVLQQNAADRGYICLDAPLKCQVLSGDSLARFLILKTNDTYYIWNNEYGTVLVVSYVELRFEKYQIGRAELYVTNKTGFAMAVMTTT